MDVLRRALISTCIIAFFGGNCSESCENDLTGKSAAVRLSNDLLCSYERNVRPVMNRSTQTNVATYFYIFNIHMEEQWDILHLDVHLIMTWKDEFLVWDSSKYDNINYIYQDSTTIWIPDIISYNMRLNGDIEESNYFLPRSMVKINNNGMVQYSHRIKLNSYCLANLVKWPFDSHNCTFYIGSPYFTNIQVIFSFPDGYYNLTYYNSDREWKVKNIDYSCYKLIYNSKSSNGHHCILQYKINIERFSSFYYSSVIIPAIVISLMRTFTFLMGHRTLLRIILLCLFFISELLYLQFLDIKIPNNGEHLVYIILLYRNSSILTATAIVINVISNELYKRSTDDLPSDGPEWLKFISIFLLNKIPIIMLTSFNTQGADFLIEKNVEEDTINSRRDKKALFWKQLSIILDRLSFIIILVISLINFLFLIP